VADVTVNIDDASNALLAAEVGPYYGRGARSAVQTMKRYRLSLFDSRAVAYYSQLGLFPSLTIPRTSIVRPKNGSILKGTVVMDSQSTDPDGVASVKFLLEDGTTHREAVIATASLTVVGWIALWNTTGMADGTYMLSSVASGHGGRTASSIPIRIVVSNP
jgi:hypothetical protein